MVEQELLTPGVLRERLARTEVREDIESALGLYTEELLDRPFSYWLENNSGNFPLAELLNDFVNSDVFDSFLEEIIKNRIFGSDLKDKTGSSFGDRLKSGFRDIGVIFVPTARDLIKNGLVREMKNQSLGGTSVYRIALESLIEKYPNLSTREFLSLGEMKKHRVDSFLAEKTVETLDENIESALSSVNVQILVSDRINSLDMIRVEKIILDVLAGQLKWINYFGAIIGALIGLFQVFFSFVIR
jgi:hypothetical protein